MSQSQRSAFEQKRLAEIKRFDERIGEDGLSKIAKIELDIIKLKSQIDTINLQKKRTKDISAESYNYPCFRKETNRTPWISWFEEFSSPRKSLQKLITKATTATAPNNRIPLFKKREEALDVLYQYKVLLERALWYLKASQVGDCMCDQQKKSKKMSVSDYSLGKSFLKERK